MSVTPAATPAAIPCTTSCAEPCAQSHQQLALAEVLLSCRVRASRGSKKHCVQEQHLEFYSLSIICLSERFSFLLSKGRFS